LKQEEGKAVELQHLIGKFIPIPLLGEELDEYPKDFNPDFPFLFLTQQMVDLLNEVITRNSTGKRIGGYVYTGPNGVGKSGISYLIASYAYVNGYPLVYIPLCSKWVHEYTHHNKDMNWAALYFLKTCYRLNRDVFDSSWDGEISILKQYENSNWRDITCVSTTTCASFQVSFGEDLNRLRTFYIFDEHNELFTSFNPRVDSYFTDFTKWSGATLGSNTTTLYFGSSHSKFLGSLPQGAITRHIHPITESEFTELITIPKNNPFFICKRLKKKKSLKFRN
jgi:hypothetical protein